MGRVPLKREDTGFMALLAGLVVGICGLFALDAGGNFLHIAEILLVLWLFLTVAGSILLVDSRED